MVAEAGGSGGMVADNAIIYQSLLCTNMVSRNAFTFHSSPLFPSQPLIISFCWFAICSLAHFSSSLTLTLPYFLISPTTVTLFVFPSPPTCTSFLPPSSSLLPSPSSPLPPFLFSLPSSLSFLGWLL